MYCCSVAGLPFCVPLLLTITAGEPTAIPTAMPFVVCLVVVKLDRTPADC